MLGTYQPIVLERAKRPRVDNLGLDVRRQVIREPGGRGGLRPDIVQFQAGRLVLGEVEYQDLVRVLGVDETGHWARHGEGFFREEVNC